MMNTPKSHCVVCMLVPELASARWYPFHALSLTRSVPLRPWFTLDGSTHLAWNMTHLRNLKKFCPSTKIAVLTCDPVKRLVSHWNYRRFVVRPRAVKFAATGTSIILYLHGMLAHACCTCLETSGANGSHQRYVGVVGVGLPGRQDSQ
jgi:hypothetical protein